MKTLNKVLFSAAAVAFTSTSAFAQLSLGENCGCPPLGDRSEILVSAFSDAQGNINGSSVSLTCNNTYVLDRTIYVGDGESINIASGTIIRGQQGTGFNAKSVVISRGGKIYANGTEDCPIIFTSTLDPLDGTHPVSNNAEWGGLILLGKATNNLLLADGDLAVGDGVGSIEGFPTNDSRNYYGAVSGTFNDDDNSGVMRYVSIRHGGSVVGDPNLGNDINGLTLGSVGRGTTLEHIEVVANFDDGIEFFGGTVDLKYASVLFCGDDYFDYDQGYTGRNQFIFGVQMTSPTQLGDEGFEADGDDEDSGNQPTTAPTIYNATLIGNADDSGVLAKEGFRGRISNSIFVNFTAGVRLDDDASRPVFDALDNFNDGSLIFTNNAFDGVTDILRVNGSPAPASVLNTFTNAGNSFQSGIIDFDFEINPAAGNSVTNAYNAVPNAGTATSPELAPVDGFFSGANYKGAFKPGGTPWNSGYTLTDLLDLDNSLVDCPSDINKDGSINGGDFLTFGVDFGTSCSIE